MTQYHKFDTTLLLLIMMGICFTSCRNLKDLSDYRKGPVCVSEKNKNGIAIQKIKQKNKQSRTYTANGIAVDGFDLSYFSDTIALRPFTSNDIEQIKKGLGKWYSVKDNYSIKVSYFNRVIGSPRHVYKLDLYNGNWRLKGVHFVLLKFDDSIFINVHNSEEMTTQQYKDTRSDIVKRLGTYYTEEDVTYVMEDFDKGPQEWILRIGRHVD